MHLKRWENVSFVVGMVSIKKPQLTFIYISLFIKKNDSNQTNKKNEKLDSGHNIEHKVTYTPT